MKHYIYTLSCDGIVFYIGRTKDLQVRMIDHTNLSCANVFTKQFVLSMRAMGKIIEPKIIDECEADVIKELEKAYINIFIIKRHKLTNVAYNPIHNRLIL